MTVMGGYLVPSILNSINYCFSAGVGNDVSFERELSKSFNIISFLTDASISSLPCLDKNFVFTNKFIGTRTDKDQITLSDWIDSSIGDDPKGSLLKLDIEGAEYDVLLFEDSSILAKFTVIVIEFHYVERLFQTDFFRMFDAILEKLYKNFSICHMHPNNCCGSVSFKNINIVRTFELTFIRKDLIGQTTNHSQFSLPHPLDWKNVTNKPDIEMPFQWYQE